jgi:transcriptional regulator with XRE-family HTH domain
MKKIQPDFGRLLKELRKKKKMTLNHLAELSGLSPSYLSRVERGERSISNLRLLKKLAPHLGLTFEEIIASAGFISWDTKKREENYYQDAPDHWKEIIKDPELDKAIKEIASLTSDEKEGLLLYLQAIKLKRNREKNKK